MLYCTVAAPQKVVLSGFSLVLLMYIIDEAEEKGSVQWSTISYQKANLNLPHHDQPRFQSHRGSTATSSALPAGGCKLVGTALRPPQSWSEV